MPTSRPRRPRADALAVSSTSVRPSPLSLMREGLLDPLGAEEVRDLFAYLMGRAQVPLPRPGR